MIEFKVKVEGLEKTVRVLDDLHANQIPFALSKSLNKIGQMIKDAERAEMEKVFDRPTPYTLGSLMMRPSTKRDLKTTIGFREWAGKGNTAENYLRPQIYGGLRKRKGFEKLLAGAGNLPTGTFAVPGGALKLNQYGNITGAQVVKILSALRSFPEVGYIANRAAARSLRLKKKQENFIVLPKKKGKLLPGIYEYLASSHRIRPVLIFVTSVNYRRLFDFFGVGEKIFDRNWDEVFAQELNDAIKTAK